MTDKSWDDVNPKEPDAKILNQPIIEPSRIPIRVQKKSPQKKTQRDVQLDAMRTLAHAYIYIEREQAMFAARHTSEYWWRQQASMKIMEHFYRMAKELTMHAFTVTEEAVLKCGICGSLKVHFDNWVDINVCSKCGAHETPNGWRKR